MQAARSLVRGAARRGPLPAAAGRNAPVRPLFTTRAAANDAKTAEAAGAAGAAGAAPPGGDEVARLKESLEQQEAKLKELEDKYRRVLAETENVRARGRRDTENARLFGIQKFAKELTDVADVLFMALNSVPEGDRTSDAQPVLRDLYAGVSMTERELMKIFERHGIVPVDPVGKPFDPNLHNALLELDDPTKEPGTVAFVQKRGFVLNDRPLRVADVAIVRRRG